MITRRIAAAGLAATLASIARKAESQAGVSTSERAAAHASDPMVVWTARPAKVSLRPNSELKSDLWTFGEDQGAVLRVKYGSELFLRLRNETPLPLSFYFHGLRGAKSLDSMSALAKEPMAPGQSRDYRFTPPDPGTFLLRPCVIGRSAEPTERGLSALLVVEEKEAPPLDHDLPLLVDDWLLAQDGSLAPFAPPSGTPLGRLGNLLTVNGKAVPRTVEVAPGSRVRLRLANACNARIMRLRFAGLEPYVAAIDGQPTDTFEPLNASLPFAPGTRYDLLLDVPDRPGARGEVIAAVGENVPLLALVAAGERRTAGSPVVGLPRNDKLPTSIRLENATRRDVVLEGDRETPWTVNGMAGHPTMAPLVSVKRGSPVVLALTNQTPYAQPMHLHGHVFRLLHSFDDGWEPYFLDTLPVPEARTVRIAFVADNPGKWLLASTVLERFDAGLWTWIEVR